MAKKKNEEPASGLEMLIQAASAEVLGKLIQKLAVKPEIRRECLTFLQNHVRLTTKSKREVESEAAFALWDELEPDLEELDRRGGGPEAVETRVANLLHELTEKLEQTTIPKDARLGLLDSVMPFIRSGNAGMDDPLYDLAYAICKTDADWRELAQQLEDVGKDWPRSRAQDVYRRLSDRKK